jgi:hypothetical protein
LSPSILVYRSRKKLIPRTLAKNAIRKRPGIHWSNHRDTPLESCPSDFESGATHSLPLVVLWFALQLNRWAPNRERE